ncbi:hypothetical protein [Burkholderia sp. 22313]|uniref:hypothetical protein n=1 Tax=Burkholderia sp. 22313 TaxID=3453908 RepID=UPI003F829719
MIKNFIFIIFAIAVGSAYAKSTCDDLHREQSYPPLNINSGTICFVLEPVLDAKTKSPIGANAISLYHIESGGAPKKAEGRGLLYDDAPGKIIDAFSLDVGCDRTEKIFVIHSIEVRESLVEPNSSGEFYSVDVFDINGKILRRDERASDWFGSDYSFLSSGSRVVYKYPYQSRDDVRAAMESPFVLLMKGDNRIAVDVKQKAYLFDGPGIGNRTKKYLIKGDRAVVEKMTAGWCRINYSGGAKPLEMWLMCGALDPKLPAKKGRR